MKIVSRRVVASSPEKLERILKLKDFYTARNKILIIRSVGGLGDILMHRATFEDIKLLMPDCEIHFACPAQYHDAVIDHPFLDKVLDSGTIKKTDYIISYNTTSACGRYEMRIAPFADKNRSDIWAEHCGFILTKHNMHIRLSEEEKAFGKAKIEEMRDREGRVVLLAPISAMLNKNLLDFQIKAIVDYCYGRGLCVLGLHYMSFKGMPCLAGLSIRQWMGVISQADYVISVDTSTFHCAGGLGKPLLGIFTWACGKTYGKYYDFELVQLHRDTHEHWTCGPCYNWCLCPKTKDNLKPCLTEISEGMLVDGVERMLGRWPINTSCLN